jgi:hypothetical protein
MSDEVAVVLQRLSDSEVPFSINTFIDGHFDVVLARNARGDRVASASLRTIEEATEWLRNQVVSMYPNSEFARHESSVAVS